MGGADQAHTTPVHHAWKAGQELTLHGWICGIEDGLLRDLAIRAASRMEVAEIRRRAKGEIKG